MIEQAITFGADNGIAGVLTLADTDSRLPHVLILNSGVVHHVGPGRMGVEVARQLAQDGFNCLRFDFSGIGDSAPRVPPLDPIASGIADVKDAMDHLEATRGVNRFIVLGLCSGARHAHYVAIADARVVGTVLLDGYAFPTIRSKLQAFGIRLQRPLRLVSKAGERIRRTFTAKPIVNKPRLPDDEGLSFFPADPTRDEMASALAQLMERDVNLLCIFSGEWDDYRYEGQFREGFSEIPFGTKLTERRIERADHLYFTRPERAEMMTTVTSWLNERFR